MPRVLITRASHQASELAEQLRSQGIEPILIPIIELAEPSSYAPLDSALAQLETFHWLIFTSANAVEVFARRVEGAQKALEEQLNRSENALKIAAIGPATARALASMGLTPNLIPPIAVAESLAESLLPYALRPDRTPTRMLLIRAELARDILPETLNAAGAEITIAPAYRTIIPADSIPRIQSLFKSPETYPDAITFTSSSMATKLLALLEVSGLILPLQIPRISIGPVTSKTLRDLGLPPNAEATEPALPALVAAVTSLFSTYPGQGSSRAH